jgi:hypothetical protein
MASIISMKRISRFKRCFCCKKNELSFASVEASGFRSTKQCVNEKCLLALAGPHVEHVMTAF